MLAYATINGLSLRYFDSGDKGDAVVFQHGLAADHTQCLEVFSGLDGLRRITLESRGHGASALGDTQALTIPVLADDLLRLLDRLGIDSAWFGGISMGAALVAHLASAHPERVRGLLLVRPAWFDAPMPVNLWCLLALAALMRQYPPAQARALFLASDSYREIAAASPDNAAVQLALLERDDPEALAAVLSGIICCDPGVAPATIAGLDIPVAIVGNEQDPLHPYALARRWAAALPQASLSLVPSRSQDRARHFSEIGAHLRALCAG
ncbi:alpha/beta hydrolase [Paludibacterium yongneupense]|uniref:alpha/beta hydrolase n=1 Tax=Paludibacterium yongneupense TaxID=400061 RepID=UPI0004201FC6|nr:alpha/beta hydrolase [Paludibacterium yongneupense]